MTKIFILLLLTLSLTGCATSQITSNNIDKPLGNHYLDRSQRHAQLSTITNWNARGSIAIHTQQKGWNASFNWQQQNTSYNIALFGPLGTNHIQLSGNPQQVTLQTANRRVSASTPEELLRRQVGWNIPVSDLVYWLRGLPGPDSRSRQSYDINNHLVQLTQQGWHIIYLRYTTVNGTDLPNRLLLSNPSLQIRIVISQWDT